MSITRRLLTGALATLAALTLTATTTAPASAATKTRMTNKISTLHPYQTDKATITGSITPAPKARTVYLQRKVGNTYRSEYRIATAKGRYAFPLPTSSIGKQTYRVYAPAASGATSAYSSPFTITTRQWIVSKVTQHSCKRINGRTWDITFTVYFTNGRKFGPTTGHVRDTAYLDDMTFRNGLYVNLNHTFKTC